jgi:hypothetical protein
VEPLRRELVKLPLQRSLFGGLWRAAGFLDLAGVVPGGRFRAHLAPDGSLFVDAGQAEALGGAFRQRLASAYLERVDEDRRRRCETARRLAHRAARLLGDASSGDVRAMLIELGGAIAELPTYAILTKFVPGRLLEAMREAGDHGPPPVPDPSPGLRLSRALLGVARSCAAAGYRPERLAAAWPEVPPAVSDRVLAYCRESTGFGPVGWDAPGHEEPGFVVGVIGSAFAGLDVETLATPVHTPSPPSATRDADPPTSDDGWPGALRRSLAEWLEFMDLEIWHIRGAFYRGLLPLLRRLARELHREGALDRPEDALFLEIGEFKAGLPPREELVARRDRYLSANAYLARAGIRPGRLEALIAEP